MVDGVPAMMGLIHMLLARQQWSPERESNLLDGGAPFYRCYETADGKHLSVGPLEPHFFADLLKKAGLPEEEIATQYAYQQWPQKREQYQALFKTKTRDQWMAIFDESDACVAPVLGFDEVESHSHNAARENFLRVDGIMQAAPAPRFDRTPASTPTAPLAAGANATELLSRLGYSEAEIETLKESGALS
jgi:alpha-methylacyl-CoA racemase